MNFLQQQFELLKLIQDNNLDAGILDGLTLGLEADAGDLMDAMVAALTQMIQAAEDELGIHSPSAWARGAMMNVMDTLAITAQRQSAALKDSLGRALSKGLEPALAVAMPGVGAQTTDNSRRSTVYGGYHVHVAGRRESALQRLWEDDL
jgi:hypothetical protein